jgi:hypothetical protein
MSLSDFLLGSTSKNAKRELLTYDPTEGGRQKDLGDYLGDFFTRQGAALDKATKELYVKQLKSDNENALADLKKYGIAVPEITGETTKQSIANLIERNKETVNLQKEVDKRSALAGYTPEAGDTYQQKLVKLKEFKEAEADAAARKVGGSVETALYNRGQQQQQNNLQMLQFQNQSADRTAQRRMDNRRIDLQEARDARKGQREMMMMIMAGLKNIGQGFY